MADGREEFSLSSKIRIKIDGRFDISTFLRWQEGTSRGVDILGTRAFTSDVNSLISRDFENLLQPLSSKGYDH